MVDYYEILDIKRTASAVDIKSAYRRLARERHPDVNGGSDKSARDFALIALAYRTLSNPQERAHYDQQRERALRTGSVMNSTNPHAYRMRRATAQRRWDQAVDRWLEVERRETFARTQAVFTTVTLFLSTFFVAVLKPRFWHSFDLVGRAILLTLFLIGLWHIAARLRACFERYTYQPKRTHRTITGEEEKSDKPFTRSTASTFLVSGYVVSLAAGLLVGQHMDQFLLTDIVFFDQQIRPDLLFYPPIAVLIVDTLHTLTSKID
ncbi:MAG: J domain-containing protein [Pyrinomonadaceae bacterium]|nr:J domain-containing protein [Pyrinomonadaceae bacterium]